MTGQGVGRLVGAVAEVLGSPGSVEGTSVTASACGDLQTAVRQALNDPGLLPPAIAAHPPDGGFAKYLLHARPGFVLMATVTLPACDLPIHDHGAWGLVGLYRGTEDEICYLPGDGKPGQPLLVEAGRLTHSGGSIMVIGPPPNDIHRVVNRGDEPSIGIHLFPRDVVASGFRIYPSTAGPPADTGPMKYDPIPPGYSHG